MQTHEIRAQVSEAVTSWRNNLPFRRRELEFSQGAIDALAQMIVNIQDDPSGYWIDYEPDQMQRQAINIIPNFLNDIFLRKFPMVIPPIPNKITSWEIWHGISRALESWCPIPKEF
jgi:hypothetical protein